MVIYKDNALHKNFCVCHNRKPTWLGSQHGDQLFRQAIQTAMLNTFVKPNNSTALEEIQLSGFVIQKY